MRSGKTAIFATAAAGLLLAFGSAATAAGAADTPEALMRKIMASYKVTAKGSNAMIGEKYFDPALTKLDQDNSKLMDGVDVLDSDPVCGCQDVGGTYRWSGHSQGAGWIATVSDSEAKGSWQVVWEKIGGRWLIYDVIEPDQGSIRGLLERHNKCAREKIAKHQKPDACTDVK
jgi:hypothetical protein